MLRYDAVETLFTRTSHAGVQWECREGGSSRWTSAPPMNAKPGARASIFAVQLILARPSPTRRVRLAVSEMHTVPLSPPPFNSPRQRTRQKPPSSSSTDLERATMAFGVLFLFVNIALLCYWLPHPDIHSHLLAHRQSRAAAKHKEQEQELPPPPPPPHRLLPPPPPPRHVEPSDVSRTDSLHEEHALQDEGPPQEGQEQQPTRPT